MIVMENAEGSLCSVCMAAFRCEARIDDHREWGRNATNPGDFYSILHHRRCCDFEASEANGSFLCAWLCTSTPTSFQSHLLLQTSVASYVEFTLKKSPNAMYSSTSFVLGSPTSNFMSG
ncbi:hypothetical protein HGRIS_004079 [Hohenbuehelia grisea]|uniref:Uncharacterized protein n=1 Tax=Hohenbuehelia grisea TaxID=104357 RepID=A0ABR3JHH7_9AGAR